MLPEVQRIIEAHASLRKGAKGPDSHNSILRSSVLMLCAAWELYCESVVFESAVKIARAIPHPEALPGAIQTQIKLAVHDENVFKSRSLRLAGNGWRIVYLQTVRDKCKALNTPKSKNLDQLFLQCLGAKKISESWSVGQSEIDRFVRTRGEIAHNGSEAQRISREAARHFKSIVQKSISETDDALYDYFKSKDVLGRAPWQRTSKM